MKNLFITFEGIDGCGKSTQAKLLFKKLSEISLTTILTEEPGGTTGANEIRKLLLRENNFSWSVETEVLLFMAARNDHVEKKIKPALKKGNIVICDRFIDSTLVYQGMRSDLAKRICLSLYDLIGQAPSLTFLIDMNPKQALERALSRKNNEDRFENYGVPFQIKVRNNFLKMAKENPKRIVVLEGNNDKDQLADDVFRHVEKHITSKISN
jgi:dTMP kinase